ncbi:hypothetical protein [uncultured Dokdonia sp.]|uniref:hypothetical protein n=1 Tax=uncultured Dokdonia sp. TaxID=575653 RepID=UPI002636FC1F|nr:hypothetical protein [uncultured Dokdonia sp.]
MKSFFYILFSLVILASCDTSPKASSSLTKYIPRKAAVVIKTNDFKDLKSALVNNDLIQELAPTALYKTLVKGQTLCKDIQPDGETLLCYTKLGRNDYDISMITKAHASLFKGDSLLMKEAALKDPTIKTLGGTAHYLIYKDVLIASTSKILLENVLREDNTDIYEDDLFEKAYTSSSNSAKASIFIRGSEGASLYKSLFPNATANALKNSFSWTAADVDLDNNDIRLSGVALVQDSTSQRLSLLKDTQPVVNRIASITPTAAIAVEAITYDDWQQFKSSKADFLKLDLSKYMLAREDLFASFSEVGMIHLPKGKVIVGVSTDITVTGNELASASEKAEFRKVSIYEINMGSAFAKAYSPLLNLSSPNLYASIDDFYLFAENQESLETVIANYQNKATLSNSATFQNTESTLSRASSYLYISSLGSNAYKELASEDGQKVLKDITLDGYDYSALQLIQEKDYLLLNMAILKNDEATTDANIAQIANVKLSADITMTPQLVTNHRTNGQDVVVQDVNNTLYLISNAGKVLWQKDLDGQILGNVQQIDLYRNGRLQLAFTTPSSFYVLDRNGKEVSPYPLSFKDNITQPLSIFDYDNNSNYRFVIVQNDKVLMYDKKAKAVSGFTFREAGSAILYRPAHMRIGNKDYITIAENSGKLHILNRTGKTRIDVKEKINFGDTPIYRYGNNFETFTVNGEKVSINTSGKLTQTISDFQSDSKIAIEGKLKVGLRENKLVVNGKKREIAFGTYTSPSISSTGKSQYIAITNTESSEVYIYDNKGVLLPNFPIYGTSKADVGFLQSNKSLGFVTQGSSNSVLIYKIN